LGGPAPGEDEFDRRLRELTEEISSAARIREPSAAERTKAAKKRKVKRRRGGRVVGWSVTAVVLAVAGFFGWHQVSTSNVGGPNDTQVVTNGAVPRTSASASPTAPRRRSRTRSARSSGPSSSPGWTRSA
jgi:uncharacterized membrane-anchored protein